MPRSKFEENYKENAHLQKGFNAVIIDALVAYFLRTIPDAKTRPIRILDICCGDGGITAALLEKLESAGIQVSEIVGYDIADAQIKVANKNHGDREELTFKVQDVQTMTDSEEYDAVISLFGLHWMDDIDLAAKKIHHALKPDGKLMYFIPLEKIKLFALRKELIQSDKWRSFFEASENTKAFELTGFHSTPDKYTEAFQALFTSESDEAITGTQQVVFERERFVEFLSSWMQEVNHLKKPEERESFVNDLVDSLPLNNGACHDAERTTGNEVNFFERLLWGFERKKETASEPKTVPKNMAG